MDPVTISLAIGVASKAFDAIKSGFAMGRDLEQMSGDLSRWMGASSDIDQAEKQAKNPECSVKFLVVEVLKLLHCKLTQPRRT
jgi:hypothetical protein